MEHNILPIQKSTEQFLNFCKTQRRLSPDSIKAYSFDLKRFNAFLTSLTLPISQYSAVTKQTLEDYVATLQNYKVKTIRRKLAGVCSLFTYLEYEDLIEHNPFAKFKLRMREPQVLKESMTIEEVGFILKTAYNFNACQAPIPSGGEGTKKRTSGGENLTKEAGPQCGSNGLIGLRDIAVLELLFACGMRVSELCHIRFDDVDLSNARICLHGKGNKERMAYLENSEVSEAFRRYLESRLRREKETSMECPYVFITRLGSMLSTQAVRNLVTKYAKMAGIDKNITPHIFRHSFASLMLEEGVDIKYIQDLLGHSSISTTQLYLHTSENAKRSVVAKMHPRKQLMMR